MFALIKKGELLADKLIEKVESDISKKQLVCTKFCIKMP